LGTGHEITCIACDDSGDDSTRLATGTRDRLVQVWKLDSKAQLHPVFSVQLDMTVPKAVVFGANGNKDIYVLGVFDGNLYVIPFPP
jgi:WD40 repeat protein